MPLLVWWGYPYPVKTRVSATDPVGLVALICIWKNPAGCACWLAEACGATVIGDSIMWRIKSRGRRSGLGNSFYD